MTHLPRALARWRGQLELFPEDIATALGTLVQRLAPTLDALVAAQETPSGDVDGFDGITHRGSYERLLPTEWMLQRAAPLEFLRRVVNAEHSFLRIARREPAAPESTLVLLDAGPDQVGDCRLAQLALLVLLIERAEARGHELVWQLLHLQTEGLRRGLSEQAVRGFLLGRTGSRCDRATLDAWADASKRRRLWLVGSPAVMALEHPAFARISLRERVAPTARVLDVKLVSGARARDVALPLPEPAVAVRLLRDPFERAKAPRSKLDGISSHLLLSPKGSRLFYRNGRGHLASVPIPNSPRAPVGTTRNYPVPEGAMVSSVGGRGRKLVWLTHAQGEVSVHFADNRQRPKDAGLVADGPLPERDTLGPLAWFPGEQMAVYSAYDHTLWRTDFRTRRSVCIAEGVRAWIHRPDAHLVAVDRWLKEPQSPCVLDIKPYNEWRFLSAEPWHDAKLAAVDPSGKSFTLGVEHDRVWELQQHTLETGRWVRKATTSLHAPSDTIVFGIEGYTSRQPHPGLWLLESDRRTISIVRLRSTQRVITTTGRPIAHACLASAAPVLALTTADGELQVLDDDGRVLYRGTAGT